MNRKNLLHVSIILLIVVVGYAHSLHGGNGEDNNDNNDKNDKNDKNDNNDGDGHSNKDSNSQKDKKPKDDNGYGDGGIDGYYDSKEKSTGAEGKDPRRDGIDVGDFGPVDDKGPSMLSSLNIWISVVDNWKQKGSQKYGSDKYGSDKYGSDKYGSDKSGSDKYDSDKSGSDKYGSGKSGSDKYGSEKKSYKDGKRRKRSYAKVNFPVKQVKDYRKFPLHRFPPLISIAPWLPVFYDKLTYQTFIFSLTGGIYIIPPLINFYGQRFAVAQLIKWGYASLVSSGVPPPPAVNVAPLVQPGPPVVAGVGGGPAPAFNPNANKFNGGVKTDFPTFRPRPNYLQNSANNSPPAKSGSGPYSG